jgi:hypothetical protein
MKCVPHGAMEKKKTVYYEKGWLAIYDKAIWLQVLPSSFHIIYTLLNEKLQAEHNTTIFPIYLFIYLN